MNFIKSLGDDYLTYTDEATINAQKSILSYILKKIGANILQGTGIMNVSLPIDIFEPRSLLDVFAHQLRLAENFLNKAYQEKKIANKIKWVSFITIYTL